MLTAETQTLLSYASRVRCGGVYTRQEEHQHRTAVDTRFPEKPLYGSRAGLRGIRRRVWHKSRSLIAATASLRKAWI